MSRRTIYATAAVVFAVSLATTVFLHYFQLQAVADLAGVPAIGALFLALFQLGRDSIAFERTLRLEELRNSFGIGATSHMASIAFDKHAAFCEEYMAAVYQALEALFRTGPQNVAALDHAGFLRDIRKKHAVWLTPELEELLIRFEGKIRSIGADAQLLAAMPGDSKAINRMFAEFANVFGPEHGFKEWDGKPVSGEHSITAIIAHLRSVLGIGELTRLRTELVSRAAGAAKTKEFSSRAADAA